MNLKLIVTLVESKFDLPKGSLQGKSRERDIAEARHAYWLAAFYTGYSPTWAARYIDYSHATGYNSVKQCLYLCLQDKIYRQKIGEIINKLKTDANENNKNKPGLALFRCAVDTVL